MILLAFLVGGWYTSASPDQQSITEIASKMAQIPTESSSVSSSEYSYSPSAEKLPTTTSGSSSPNPTSFTNLVCNTRDQSSPAFEGYHYLMGNFCAEYWDWISSKFRRQRCGFEAVKKMGFLCTSMLLQRYRTSLINRIVNNLSLSASLKLGLPVLVSPSSSGASVS